MIVRFLLIKWIFKKQNKNTKETEKKILVMYKRKESAILLSELKDRQFTKQTLKQAVKIMQQWSASLAIQKCKSKLDSNLAHQIPKTLQWQSLMLLKVWGKKCFLCWRERKTVPVTLHHITHTKCLPRL